MNDHWSRAGGFAQADDADALPERALPPVAPGKVTRTLDLLPRRGPRATGASVTVVQRREDPAAGTLAAGPLDAAEVRTVAAAGVAGAAGPLPFLDVVQRAFGRHDVRGLRAHVGGAAAEAARGIGARAYATGNHVAFAREPDLHTVAHEAAHAVQQRGGVQLGGGVGAAEELAAAKRAWREANELTSAESAALAQGGTAAEVAEALREAFRRSSKVRSVKAVSLKQLRQVLGRAGAKPGRFRLVAATKEELEALGIEANAYYGWVSRDGAGVVRTVNGKPVITFTPLGLSSLEQAVKTFGHEAKHLRDFAAGLITSDENLAELAGEALWTIVEKTRR